jgi:DNA-binding response OmpR family regulator
VKKILIVEDDPSIAASLEIRLRESNYQVILAADAIQGTSMAVKLKPDLIILDVSLPAGNGLGLAQQFKKLPETAETPVIAITASKAPQFREMAMSLHLAGFFEKPYEIDELRAVIRSTLARHSSDTDEPEALTQTNRKPRDPRLTRRKKILIIEDDTRIAMALGLRLKAAGYETILAFDALLGLTNAVKLAPDLVLLDISLPGGSGLDVAQKIQKLVPNPPPMIFLTASKQEGLREKTDQLGAVAFFEKPYEAEDLMATINSLLQEHAADFTCELKDRA